MDDIQDLYSSYRDAERAWIQSITTTTLASGASGSIEDCSLHYGEIGFLLAGLKPCVLIQLPTPELTRSLYSEVLESQWIQRDSFKRQQQNQDDNLGLSCRLITRDVQSPEMPLQGCVLVWSQRTIRSHPQSNIIQRAIDMFFPSAEGESDNGWIISEQDMAVILDIPGRLPENELEVRRMVEVSYWHQVETLPDTQPVLLTAFAAQPDQMHSIQAHFKRYKYNVQRQFGVLLKLHVQSMADIA
jgi:hypothetical protein